MGYGYSGMGGGSVGRMGMGGGYPMGGGSNMMGGMPGGGVTFADEPEEPDKIAIGLEYVRCRTAKHLHLLEIKAYLRKISLCESEIDEVLRRAGRQPAQTQYGVRTKEALDERAAARYRRHEATQREQARLGRTVAAQTFARVAARPSTFFYELERGYAEPVGEVSAETLSSDLPHLLGLRVVTPRTRIWSQNMADWQEWQECADLFALPESGPGSVSHALLTIQTERDAIATARAEEDTENAMTLQMNGNGGVAAMGAGGGGGDDGGTEMTLRALTLLALGFVVQDTAGRVLRARL